MIKSLRLVSLCALLSTQLQAQITINASDLPSNKTGNDTVYSIFLDGTVPAVSAATNKLWNFSNTSYDSKYYVSRYNAVTGFTNATTSNTVYYDSLGGSGSFHYETDLMFAVSSSGIKTYGERLKRQAYKIQGGGPNDSVVILAQDVVYDQPTVTLALPLTTNSSWNSTSHATYNMSVIYMSAPLSAQRKTTITTNSQVIGWGDAKLKFYTGQPAGAIHVLEVESQLTNTDSFFVNGSPAPGSLLTQAGLTQGKKSYIYTRNFYRKGELTPLVSVSYKDAAYTQLKDINIHRDRLPPFDESVANVTLNNQVKLYPNPASGGSVNIEFSVNNTKWSYELISINGQILAADALNVNGSKASVNIPANTATGNYYLKLINEKGEMAVKQLTIQ